MLVRENYLSFFGGEDDSILLIAFNRMPTASSNPPNVDLLRPFEYSLNISLPTIGQPTTTPLRGQLSILAELTEPAGILALNFDQNLAKIDEDQVRIWDCQRGENRGSEKEEIWETDNCEYHRSLHQFWTIVVCKNS